MRIVGEKGDGGSWTDYRFNISSCLTTSSSETAPSPLGRSNWEDAPMATTTAFPYLWMMVQRYSDADTKDGNATYARLTGEKSPQGQTGGVLSISTFHNTRGAVSDHSSPLKCLVSSWAHLGVFRYLFVTLMSECRAWSLATTMPSALARSLIPESFRL